MAYVKKMKLKPLSLGQQERITEINFHAVMVIMTRKLGTPAVMNSFLTSLALSLAISPDDLIQLSQKTLGSANFPVKKEELIEIYYRHDYSRKNICKICKVHDSRIKEVIESGTDYILQTELNKGELIVAKKVLAFYTDIAEVIL